MRCDGRVGRSDRVTRRNGGIVFDREINRARPGDRRRGRVAVGQIDCVIRAWREQRCGRVSNRGDSVCLADVRRHGVAVQLDLNGVLIDDDTVVFVIDGESQGRSIQPRDIRHAGTGAVGFHGNWIGDVVDERLSAKDVLREPFQVRVAGAIFPHQPERIESGCLNHENKQGV